MRVEIRRIRADEGPQLMRVRLMALLDAPFAFAATYTDTIQQPAEEWAARAARAANGGSEAIYLAHAEGDVVAMAGGFTPPDRPRVRSIWGVWVEPLLRGQQLGRELVGTVLAWADAAGAETTELWVVESNDPALRLYESLGYVPSGEMQSMPSNPTVIEQKLVRPAGRGRSA